MKRIKPGRGPSALTFIGSLIAIIFGLIWIATVIYLGKKENDLPTPLLLFGALFILIGVINAVYAYINAFGKKRFSLMDVVEPSEEGEPNEPDEKTLNKTGQESGLNYCPHCGNPVKESFVFCPKCGKTLKSK